MFRTVSNFDIYAAIEKGCEMAQELEDMFKSKSCVQLVREQKISFIYHPCVARGEDGIMGPGFVEGTKHWATHGAVEHLCRILDNKPRFARGQFGSVWLDADLTGGVGHLRRTVRCRVTPMPDESSNGAWKLMLDNTFENPFDESFATTTYDLQTKWPQSQLSEKLENQMASLNSTDARRSQRNAKKRERKKRSAERQREQRMQNLAIKRWQNAIRRVIRENRHNRVQTALNRVETRRREIVRQKAARESENKADQQRASEHARENALLARATPHHGTWAKERPGQSQIAASKGKKFVARQEHRDKMEKQRLEQDLLDKEQARRHEHMAQSLLIANAINTGK